jgi:uncharacterized protein YndB with AHSA1/START domain
MNSAPAGIQRYRTYIKAAPQQVWDAVTRPELSVHYGYAPVVDYGGAVGAHYKAYPNEGMKQFPNMPAVICDGEILEWQPPFRLVQTFRMLMEPLLAAEGFTHLSYDIQPVRGGVTRLVITHDVSRTPGLASLVAGQHEDKGAGGGWHEIVSGLKTLLETGKPLPFQSGAPASDCAGD